jgi:hypothetical protein
MNPVPPMTCGVQNTPLKRAVLDSMAVVMAGRAVKLTDYFIQVPLSSTSRTNSYPLIQKMVAAQNWTNAATKPSS